MKLKIIATMMVLCLLMCGCGDVNVTVVQQSTDTPIPESEAIDKSTIIQFADYERLNGASEGDEVTISESDVVLDGNDVEKAQATSQIDSSTNETQYAVELIFTDEGKQKLMDITSELYENQGKLAIVVDGKLLSAPMVFEPIMDGKAIIAGGFEGFDEADELAGKLNE